MQTKPVAASGVLDAARLLYTNKSRKGWLTTKCHRRVVRVAANQRRLTTNCRRPTTDCRQVSADRRRSPATPPSCQPQAALRQQTERKTKQKHRMPQGSPGHVNAALHLPGARQVQASAAAKPPQAVAQPADLYPHVERQRGRRNMCRSAMTFAARRSAVQSYHTRPAPGPTCRRLIHPGGGTQCTASAPRMQRMSGWPLCTPGGCGG